MFGATPAQRGRGIVRKPISIDLCAPTTKNGCGAMLDLRASTENTLEASTKKTRKERLSKYNERIASNFGAERKHITAFVKGRAEEATEVLKTTNDCMTADLKEMLR
eukprot:TRINITY_DN15111_c0_g1_i1.p2 TRINITY_DN15111_c0_g1~~TRINITY_DN15111_c0_g1_i1.p2  ORF type:complete len:107 (+),score=21.82 TRINITY_DN15111_c0_g1_i1:31-351(+)